MACKQGIGGKIWQRHKTEAVKTEVCKSGFSHKSPLTSALKFLADINIVTNEHGHKLGPNYMSRADPAIKSGTVSSEIHLSTGVM